MGTYLMLKETVRTETTVPEKVKFPNRYSKRIELYVLMSYGDKDASYAELDDVERLCGQQGRNIAERAL
jgi:hypothetical protein